jgi:hypothetical protein
VHLPGAGYMTNDGRIRITPADPFGGVRIEDLRRLLDRHTISDVVTWEGQACTAERPSTPFKMEIYKTLPYEQYQRRG